MSTTPKQIHSLCPACSECPSVEIYDGTVRIGEVPNLVTLRREEWNELVNAIKSGQLAEIGG
ncbi:MAG: hypothetical protein WD773_08620 [Gemmatimonadales bacterium]